jgi:hypothetical protein
MKIINKYNKILIYLLPIILPNLFISIKLIIIIQIIILINHIIKSINQSYVVKLLI